MPDGAVGAEGAWGIPPDGALGDEGIDGEEGADGADGAEGIEVGRGGASARAADVDMSGVRGADGVLAPGLPGVPVQPWPPPVVGRPAAGAEGALAGAFGAPPIGPDWGVVDGELSGVRAGDGAFGAWAGASGGATEDWVVWPVLRGGGASGVESGVREGEGADEDDGDDEGELSGVREGASGVDELSGVRDGLGASGVDGLSGVRDGDGADDGDELSGVREGLGASGDEGEGDEGDEAEGEEGEDGELSGVDEGEESGVDEEEDGEDGEDGEPEGERSGTSVRWNNPPGLMDFVEITSSPVTLPTSLPTTFMIFAKISTSLPSSGETFLMVLMSFWISSPIRAAHFEIAVTACATITGVPNPSVKTASSTHVISFATRSAIRSRTISRTNPTTMPITPTTVPTDPAVEAAPDNASSWPPAAARYASAAEPVHSEVASTAAL